MSERVNRQQRGRDGTYSVVQTNYDELVRIGGKDGGESSNSKSETHLSCRWLKIEQLIRKKSKNEGLESLQQEQVGDGPFERINDVLCSWMLQKGRPAGGRNRRVK